MIKDLKYPLKYNLRKLMVSLLTHKLKQEKDEENNKRDANISDSYHKFLQL